MFELICQQRYLSGASVDHSVYRNHGTPIDVGSSTNPNIVSFPNLDSRIAIGLGGLNAWSPIGALKIEVDVRLQHAAGPGLKLVLVHGDGSFFFWLHGGSILGVQIESPPLLTELVATTAAPPNRWITVGLYHDGYSTLQLLVDGKVVGNTNLVGPVAPVQAGGVAIGNHIGAGQPLRNEVREVRIWRRDPNAMKREFLCRPYDAAAAACWEAIFRAVQQWRRDNPAAAKTLIEEIQTHQRDFLRALSILPTSDQTEARDIVQEITKLWCKGHIDHSHMRHALRRWFAFLHRHGIDSGPPPSLSPAELQSLKQRYGLDFDLQCDPKALAFFQILEREAGKET